MTLETGKLQAVALALNSSTIGSLTTAFTRALLVSEFIANQEQKVEPVPEVRGSLAVRRVTKGIVDYKPKMKFALDSGDADSAGIGDFLASLIGTEAGSNLTGGFYGHKFTLKESVEPTMFNLYSTKDSVNKQYVGFRAGSLKLSMKASDAVITCEVDGIAKDESDLTAAQTLAYCDEELLTPHMATVFTLGGATIDSVESLDITIKREQEGIHTIGSTRTIGALASGKQFSIEIAMNGLTFADDTERAKFKAVTSSSFVLKLQDAAGNFIHFYFPAINYTTWDGPSITESDLMRTNAVAIVTGDPANWYIDLKNKYGSRYDTGAAIE